MINILDNRILKLKSTRVWRTYLGGSELEKWQGKADPSDSNYPEEWIASVVKATNPNSIKNEGLSAVETADGGELLLKDLIEKDPGGMLGAKHYAKYGNSMAILVKVIDSLNRLTIQVHPDRQYAKEVLCSDYGKTEAWYILGGREVGGEKPYVLFGFRPGITRKKWKGLFDAQDIDGMLHALNKIEVKPGEVYLIDGGVPHAIGSGCFLIEIQEPTDYTMRVEKTTPEGVKIPDMLCHQGAGFEKMLDCFHYDTYTADEAAAKWKVKTRTVFESDCAKEQVLIDSAYTKMFEMHSLKVQKSYQKEQGDAFSVMVAVKGSGRINGMRIAQGDMLFLPASLDSVLLEADDGHPLEIVQCFPPK